VWIGDRLARRLAGLPPVLVDAVLATAIIGVTLWIGTGYRFDGFREFDAQAYVLTVLVNAPLAVRRQAPVPVLLASGAALAWFLASGYVPSLNLFGPLLAMYTVAAVRPLRIAALSAVYTAAVLLYSGMAVHLYSPAFAAAQALVTTAVAWVFGTGARRLAERNERLLELAATLRHEREERARHAVTAERIRIARELHDIVAHHMSVISVQSGLARYVLPTNPETASTALAVIAGASHEGLEEMRRLLAVLRVGDAEQSDDTRPYDPAPGLARLGDLAERIRSAGVPVDVVTTGPARPLPPGADLCAYRIIQESLTNVLKHARPARATVAVTYRPGDLAIRISDDGAGSPARPAVPGQGLMGVRERARLYGGSVTARARPEGGFEVTLTLPLGHPGPDTVRTGQEEHR